MTDKLTDEQVASVLEVLDEALSGGPWSSSPFLNLIEKKLQGIRDEFLQQQENFEEKAKETPQQISERLAKRAEMIKIYVALYAFDGGKLESWERVIQNLTSHLTSRPIYMNEDDVKAFIRSRPNPVNDGYAVFYINPIDIIDLPPEKISMDKMGKPLVVLKQHAISLDNLEVFVHQTGNYQWKNSHLLPL